VNTGGRKKAWRNGGEKSFYKVYRKTVPGFGCACKAYAKVSKDTRRRGLDRSAKKKNQGTRDEKGVDTFAGNKQVAENSEEGLGVTGEVKEKNGHPGPCLTVGERAAQKH